MNAKFMMNLALNHAWKYQLLSLPNPSVAALLTDTNNNILSLEAHTKIGSEHAEVLALKEAFKKLSTNSIKLKELREIELIKSDELRTKETYNFLLNNHQNLFKDCSIFITLEPCDHHGKTPPCALLLANLKLKKIYFSANDDSLNWGGYNVLKNVGADIIKDCLRHRGEDLILPFTSLRKKNRFNLFKLAQRIDGTYKHGRISGDMAHIYSHKLRGLANNIIISGKTLRDDNPYLNTRHHPSNNPNVIIISRTTKDLDNHLNIHKTKDREITINHDIKSLDNLDGFNIIEAGWGELFNSMIKRDQIDLILTILSPKWMEAIEPNEWINATKQQQIKSKLKARFIHTTQMGEDLLIWISIDQ